MTLNEWEQRNIEVLTSREMGEWLCRRENRLLNKIRAEIEQYNRKPSHYPVNTISIETVLQIIDKYRNGENE